MSKKHEAILGRLTPETKRTLINAVEDSFGTRPSHWNAQLVRERLIDYLGYLNTVGLVVREYAVDEALKEMER